jgi:hypothetical protein
MGCNVGHRCLAIGQYQTACDSPATPISYRLGAGHAALPAPTMKKQNSHQKTSRRNQVNT